VKRKKQSIKQVGKNRKIIKQKKTKNISFNNNQSEFISATSHQFRTPLATIQSSLELLEVYISKKNTTRQQQIINKIKRSIAYLDQIVDKITTLYKYGSLKQKPHIVKIGVRKFLNELLDELIFYVDDIHYINVNIEKSIDIIYADEFILKQILSNLLSNAIKFSPAGGQVQLKVSENKNDIEFSVQDEGMGISIEDQKKLFEPFFRSENVITISGTGLGLTVVKSLAAIHKVKIEFKSKINEGTEFKVYLSGKHRV
jgi:signal transduction histidine kinase